MLTIIIDWIYMLFTCFSIGFFLRWWVEKAFRYSIRRLDSVLLAGFIMATVYAQIFSLFYRVNAEANGILAAVSILICIALRKSMGQFLRESIGGASWPRRILVAVLFLLWSFFSSRGYMVLDMDMYHGQSIRWIEEYGVVKGLGNLHCRFGYNSSIFAVSALYSLKFLLGRTVHAVNGMLAFILSVCLLDLGKAFRRKKMLLSDYARVGAIYYLTTIYDEIIAPSSDYAVMCVIFFIVVKWLTLLESGDGQVKDRTAPYALLCVAGVYALTLKLTAGLILLLVLKPAVSLLREKRWGEILLYLGLGLLVCLPWMVRTVVISGWLLYPFPALDLFSVDWKMPAGPIALDAAQIKTWGRALNNAALVDMPMREWFPGWFAALSGMEKLLILGDLACIPLFMGYALLSLLKKKKENLDILLVLVTVIGSYGFWQYSAPILRYGYAYVLLVDLLLAGIILQNLRRQQVLYAFVCLYGCYKLVMMGDYIRGNYLIDAYVWQQDYGSYELTAYELGGITFYHPAMGDRTGYADFPAAPTRPRIELRGDGLEDGFRPAGQ